VDPEKQKEKFSDVFVNAAAAVAGFATAPPGVDDDSIDWTIAETGGGGTTRSPRLELQLKCTTVPDFTPDTLRFDLSLKNYDDLRHADYQVPRILVVVVAPLAVGDWLHMDGHALVLRTCAYWLSLRGQPGVPNTTSVRVHLPKVQRFDAAALHDIMARVRQGQLP
jgi:hypothetical protein